MALHAYRIEDGRASPILWATGNEAHDVGEIVHCPMASPSLASHSRIPRQRVRVRSGPKSECNHRIGVRQEEEHAVNVFPKLSPTVAVVPGESVVLRHPAQPSRGRESEIF